jgi:hypothetical protein
MTEFSRIDVQASLINFEIASPIAIGLCEIAVFQGNFIGNHLEVIVKYHYDTTILVSTHTDVYAIFM